MYCSGRTAIVERAIVAIEELLGVADRGQYGLEVDRGLGQEIHDALEHRERLSGGRE